ncbi:hypothetical protein [Tropicimonas sp. IMCC6043]|uniref:hypothetical protein n=1 Tax=Tropicimonas sp. IMCC6043 TaxID=2510645 RepID=UPI00101D5FAE|nr:hypothetical protein [Tropicimonas sp. IMCC6043]RYH08655.1 hypothetical protein EU800_15480 [Tropicimonas sp. IMCC6043]
MSHPGGCGPGRACASLAWILALGIALPAPAQSTDPEDWTEKKCRLCRSAVADALRLLGRDGIRDVFLDRNDAFIAGGCKEQVFICAETDEETELANLLTVMTMNEGIASTFVPFGCRE